MNPPIVLNHVYWMMFTTVANIGRDDGNQRHHFPIRFRAEA